MERAIIGRKLLPKLILYSLLVFVALFVVSETAKAAVTGKIAGFVVDAETKEPLPGANIIIVGTERGAATDLDGYFFIIRLSPGTYQVQARMMGYTSVTKTGVEVITGHTTPINFELEPTVIAGEGITVTAEREVVKMDLAASSISADVTDIEAVPLISNVAQYLNLQAGIDGWSVRGSGIEETILMADGLLLVDQRVNEPIMMPNLSEIKEVSLIKGGFNAEYGNVRAGAINVVTREGSPKEYEGSFEFRINDGYLKHNGVSIFDPDNYYNDVFLWNKLDTGFLNIVMDTLGNIISQDTIIKLDSVCWKGPSEVWGNPDSPFYDTLKQQSSSRGTWIGWIAEAAAYDSGVTTPEALRDRWIWRHRIDIPYTDSLFDIYSNGMAYIPIYEVEDGESTLVGFTREPYELREPRRGTYGDLPDWTLDAGFGGPVPIIGEYLGDMSFYGSYRDYNEAFPLPDNRDYYRERQASLKLTSRFGHMKMSFRGAYSIINSLCPWATGERVGSDADVGQVYLRGAYDMLQSNGEWNGIYHGSDKLRENHNLYNPISLTPIDVTSRMLGFTLQHELSENSFYDVRMTYLRSNNDATYWYDVPLRMKDTVLIWFGKALDDSGKYIIDPGYLAEFAADNIPYGFANSSWDWDVQRIVGVDMVEYGGAHSCGSFNKSWSQTFNVRFDLTSQLDKYNQIKFGAELNYDKIHENYMINEGWEWEKPGEEKEHLNTYFVDYDADPILGGAYIQDKIEFEGMFANIGLRFDYADPNTRWPSRDSAYVYSEYYSKNLKDTLFYQDWLLEDVSAHLKLSPRLGISFPIMEKSKLFFNYGHFYSLAPNKRRFMISWGESIEPIQFIGNPWLDMARTISYEVGFESNIANTYLARVTGYYKDIDNEYAMVSYADYERIVDYNTYENLDYGDTRGFEFELRKPQGTFFTGWIIYDYRVTSSGQTGREEHYSYVVENAQTGIFDPEQTEPVPQPVLRAQISLKTPLDWGMFYGGYNLSLVYSWRGGRYETWNPFGGGDEAGEEMFYLLQNNIQWEDQRNLDLSLSKNLSIAGTEVTLFMDVHNVFNWQELHQQGFSSGGDRNRYLKSLHLEMYKEEPYASSPMFTAPAEGEKPDKIGDLRSDEKPYINNPDIEFLWYLDPRYVQFGIRFSF